jgi:hypothetical protein
LPEIQMKLINGDRALSSKAHVLNRMADGPR